MDRETFLAGLSKVFDECEAIADAKNKDYADPSDAFKNFRNAAIANITLEKGILVRMLDKITRIGNLLDHDAAVKDESLIDTLEDIINYAAFIVIYRRRQ